MSAGKSSVNVDEFFSQEDSAHVPALCTGKAWTQRPPATSSPRAQPCPLPTWSPGQEPGPLGKRVTPTWARRCQARVSILSQQGARSHLQQPGAYLQAQSPPPTRGWDTKDQREGVPWTDTQQTLEVQNDRKTEMY